MRSLVLTLTLLVGACDSVDAWPVEESEPEGSEVPATALEAADPIDLPPAEVTLPPTTFTGRYEVSTFVDVAASGVLGPYVSGTLVALSSFHDNPAGTILDLMALYNVPVVGQVWSLLPGFLEDKIEDWLDEHLFAAVFESVPVVERAVRLIDDVASISRNLELVSELTIADGGAGLTITHRLLGVGFTLWGNRTIVDVPPGAVVTAPSTATLETLRNPNPSVAAAVLRTGAHSFTLPYGEMLVTAARRLIFEPRGASSFGGYLNLMVNCTGIWHSIGNKCVLGVCVHDFVPDATMTQLCSSGLTTLGNHLENQLRGLTFDVLAMDNGRCQMWDKGYEDTVGDFRIDALSDGRWDSRMRIAGVDIAVPAYFEGRRIGD